MFYALPIMRFVPGWMKGKSKINASTAVFNKWVDKVKINILIT